VLDSLVHDFDGTLSLLWLISNKRYRKVIEWQNQRPKDFNGLENILNETGTVSMKVKVCSESSDGLCTSKHNRSPGKAWGS
jgi:adenine specific DNA methylase Mod